MLSRAAAPLLASIRVGPTLRCANPPCRPRPNNNNNTATESWFGAFGIGVSDLASAKAFYADTLGFKVSLFLPIPGQYNEYILQGYGGSALVLMNWTNGTPRNYTDNPVKLEIGSLSPEGFLQTIDDAGQRVDQQMNEDPSRNDELVGYARDADGTVLEVLLAPWGQTAP